MLRALVIIFSLSFLLVIPQEVNAANSDIVINEVSPNPSGDSSEASEFIELYNKGSETVTITGWKLSDTSGSTSTYTIPENTIAAGAYKSFTRGSTGIALNNDGDGVVLKDNSDQQIDTMSFASTIEDKSWSRNPNGTGSFTGDTAMTENAANSAPPTSTPTNTPAPTNTPTPGPISTPTKTPTPTKAPTSTPAKTPTPGKVTPSPTKKPTPTPNEEEDKSSLSLASGQDNSLKDIGQKNVSATPTPTVLGASTSNIPWLFIALGLIFISVCGILAYFQFGDKIFAFLKRKPQE